MKLSAVAVAIGLLSSPALGRYANHASISHNRQLPGAYKPQPTNLHGDSKSTSEKSEYTTSEASKSAIKGVSTTLETYTRTSGSTYTYLTTTTITTSGTSINLPGSVSTNTTSGLTTSTQIPGNATTTTSGTNGTSIVAPNSIFTSTSSTTSLLFPNTTSSSTAINNATSSTTTSTTTTSSTTTTIAVTNPTCSTIPYTGTSDPINQSLSFQDGTLGRHNYLRQFHGSSVPMTWNTTLAAAAQAEVNTCVFAHTVNNPYGENLYAADQTGGLTSQQLVLAVDDWYNEISSYNFANPGFSEATGHFTQVVWLNSVQLGCAWKDCTATPLGLYFVACEYSPAGNVGGQFPANVLPPVQSVNSCSPGTTSNPGK